MMKWVPTVQRFKEPLAKKPTPTADIQFAYNMDMVYIKLVVMLLVWIGTGATAQFVFTTDFTGVSFLNKSSRPS